MPFDISDLKVDPEDLKMTKEVLLDIFNDFADAAVEFGAGGMEEPEDYTAAYNKLARAIDILFKDTDG
jgi:hypothetical protein